jgi:2-oxoglutarate dehydrogenase E2 component (dihydrolipoamide succinyltransferase)
MSVSVSMPQLGESVTEGTVTRWLKREGDHVAADEPLLEVSTDKVDTEIPSPVSGILRGISVAEDETVAVGAELAVIDEDGAADSAAADTGQPAASDTAASDTAASDTAAFGAAASGAAMSGPGHAVPAYADPSPYQPPAAPERSAYEPQPYAGPAPYAEPPRYQPPPVPERPMHEPAGYSEPSAYQVPAPPELPVHEPPGYAEPPAYQVPAPPELPVHEPPGYAEPPAYQVPAPPEAPAYEPSAYERPEPTAYQPPAQPVPAAHVPPASAGSVPAEVGDDHAGEQAPAGADSPYVTPLVRKLASEHGIDLGKIAGTGVGGRIRKQDVLDAARDRPAGDGQPATAAAGPTPPAAPAAPPAVSAQSGPAQSGSASAPQAGPAAPVSAGQAQARPPVSPASQRGATERLSRARQIIAQRMFESLQTSAQLTTVVEADVTAIAKLRDRAKAAFEAREGVKLSFLPFFAQATVEALKIHPKLNAFVDVVAGTVTYHDAEHLGIAVDTERGLMVPVIRNAGDLNIGGLARKIADLAQRTRAGQVSPDDLSGGTFTLTNTGSRGALFDTPIINMPQVGILGTGTVNRRAVVVDDPALGEVITVRSMVHLALTYDHRLVDGADAARFLVTVKNRLEEGSFEAELGL